MDGRALTLPALIGIYDAGALVQLVGKLSAMIKTDTSQFAVVGGGAQRSVAGFAGMVGD